MSAVELHQCPECGSDEKQKVGQDSVPGGTDWRHYACLSCGYEWRV
ncbi:MULTISPECIES: hypothetical protein [unclassified Halorhabdus]|nr:MULTISPECIES: hypothetical protein [unclassified Halorhabdus]